MRHVVACLLLLAASAQAESLVAGGYHEAVFSVSDRAGYVRFFEEVAGWQVLHEGMASDDVLAAWQLPDAASAMETVVGNPGTNRGYVRLIEFTGVDQQQIRSNAQSWDTGGWFDVNSRVLDMDAMFAEYQSRDWQGASDPVQFSFGPFVVKEWLTRGPDGIVLALIERVEPPLQGWPALKKMSRIFNATQIVSDIDAARDFYIEKLGFETYLDHSGASKAAGPNVLGLPHNLATEIPREVSIVHPDGINEGSVELLEFVGADGADWSARATPPNLGILMLRFPVDDIDQFAAHVKARGITVAFDVTDVDFAPYGKARLMGLRGPDGVWLEFFELE